MEECTDKKETKGVMNSNGFLAKEKKMVEKGRREGSNDGERRKKGRLGGLKDSNGSNVANACVPRLDNI